MLPYYTIILSFVLKFHYHMTKVEITAFKIANIFVGLFIFGKFLQVFMGICPARVGGPIPEKNDGSFLCVSSLVKQFWVFDSPLSTRYVVVTKHKVFLWTTKAQQQTTNKTNPTKLCRAHA